MCVPHGADHGFLFHQPGGGGGGAGGPIDRRAAWSQAAIFGAGIIATFTTVGVVLAAFVGAAGAAYLAANPWVNLLLTGLFVAFALNLFGVYQIAIPSGWLSALDRVVRQRGAGGRALGIVGALLMGFTFTLTSFTCTAPFVGTVLVTAASGHWQAPVVGMLVYSTVFALPFCVLALVPHTLARLPRAGEWMQNVKVVMGLIELAAAMKFVSNADLVWHWGVFTREVVLGAWVVSAVAAALYLWRQRLVAGEASAGPRSLAVGLAAVAAIWLATGLSGRSLGEIESFLPPAPTTGPFALRGWSSPPVDLAWRLNDYQGALAAASVRESVFFIARSSVGDGNDIAGWTKDVDGESGWSSASGRSGDALAHRWRNRVDTSSSRCSTSAGSREVVALADAAASTPHGAATASGLPRRYEPGLLPWTKHSGRTRMPGKVLMRLEKNRRVGQAWMRGPMPGSLPCMGRSRFCRSYRPCCIGCDWSITIAGGIASTAHATDRLKRRGSRSLVDRVRAHSPSAAQRVGRHSMGEPATVGSMHPSPALRSWAALLAICGAIGLSMVGGMFSFGAVWAVKFAVVRYLSALIGIYVLALDRSTALAPTFGGNQKPDRSAQSRRVFGHGGLGGRHLRDHSGTRHPSRSSGRCTACISCTSAYRSDEIPRRQSRGLHDRHDHCRHRRLRSPRDDRGAHCGDWQPCTRADTAATPVN